MEFRGVAEPGMNWYKRRHDGPGLSTINQSHMNIRESASVTDRLDRCWDELCDDNPQLEEWARQAYGARTGSIIFKFVDTHQPPRLRETKAGNVVMTLNPELWLAHDADSTVKGQILECLARRSEIDGSPQPPVEDKPASSG